MVSVSVQKATNLIFVIFGAFAQTHRNQFFFKYVSFHDSFHVKFGYRCCDFGNNNDTCKRKEIWTWKKYILILSHDKKKKMNLWRKFPPPIRRFYNTIKLLFRQYVSWYNYFWHSFCLPLFCKTKHIPPARPITRLAWLSTVCLEVPGVFVPDLWVYVTLPAIRGEGCPDWPIEGHVCWVS